MPAMKKTERRGDTFAFFAFSSLFAMHQRPRSSFDVNPIARLIENKDGRRGWRVET
jgi:hypothetical protein